MGTMWNRLEQWDTHRDVIEGQQDGLSDSGVGYGQTESQDGRVDGQVIAPSSDTHGHHTSLSAQQHTWADSRYLMLSQPRMSCRNQPQIIPSPYHWRELPQASFLLPQTRVCRDKNDACGSDKMFVATKCLSRQK